MVLQLQKKKKRELDLGAALSVGDFQLHLQNVGRTSSYNPASTEIDWKMPKVGSYLLHSQDGNGA